MKNILKIYNIFDLKYKKYLFFLLLVIFSAMVMETLSIGMFLPLITSLLSPEKIEKFLFVQNIYEKSFFFRNTN